VVLLLNTSESLSFVTITQSIQSNLFLSGAEVAAEVAFIVAAEVAAEVAFVVAAEVAFVVDVLLGALFVFHSCKSFPFFLNPLSSFLLSPHALAYC